MTINVTIERTDNQEDKILIVQQTGGFAVEIMPGESADTVLYDGGDVTLSEKAVEKLTPVQKREFLTLAERIMYNAVRFPDRQPTTHDQMRFSTLLGIFKAETKEQPKGDDSEEVTHS